MPQDHNNSSSPEIRFRILHWLLLCFVLSPILVLYRYFGGKVIDALWWLIGLIVAIEILWACRKRKGVFKVTGVVVGISLLAWLGLDLYLLFTE